MADGLRSRVSPKGDSFTTNSTGSTCQVHDDTGATFPLSMVIQVLTVALLIFSSVIYFGITMPPAERTDLGWWREGPLYQLSDLPSIEEAQSIAEKGYFGVKSSKAIADEPGEKEKQILHKLKDLGLKFVVKIDVANFDLKNQYSQFMDLCSKWLKAGIDGLSFHFDSAIPSVLNFTQQIIQLTEAHSQNKLILVVTESSEESIQIDSVQGGTHLIQTDSDVCSENNANELAKVIQKPLAYIGEGNNQRAVLWKGCSSTQSTSRQILPFLLPGATYADPGTQVPGNLLTKIQGIKKWPSVHWGMLETVIITDDILSYVLWAKGKMYDKVFVAINVGTQSYHGNFIKKLDKFSVPKQGRVILSLRPTVKEGDIVDMNALQLDKEELMVIQFPPFGI